MTQPPPPPEDPGDEITRLVGVLQATERRLQELTGGELDAVLVQGGQSYLLQEAQAKLRLSEAVQRESAALQSAILNALPAHIALLDHAGVITFVNDGWRNFARENSPENSAVGVGLNYLEACDRSPGRYATATEAGAVAAGIRAILSGASRREFSLEYACHSPAEQRWFLLRVNPLMKDRAGGAVVMHTNITERKLAENLLRESEERFRGMFFAAATGIAISTPRGRFLQANAAYCQMLGYTEDELRARDFASVTHPDDLNLNLQMRDEVLAGRRESFTMEKRYLKKNGDIVWTRHSVSATHGVGGAVASFVVVAEDITERKCAEEALRLRQTELQALFDLIPAMVWFKDTHNRVLRVNQRAAEITGRPVTEIEGQSMRELHPPAAAKYYADDLEVIRSGAPKLAIIETLRDPNGRELLVQTDKVPVCGKDGKVSGIIVMAQDITERIKSEEALRQSRNHFKAIFEQAAVGVALADAVTGRFLQVNQRYCEIAGRSPAELELLTAAAISHPEYHARDQELEGQVKAGVIREFTLEKRYLRKDGSEIWVNVTVSAMWAPGEPPDYYLRVAQDITTLKKLEDSSRQAQKMEAMGTLAGGIAHDFNNILASINGYTELAQMTLTGNPEVREHLAAVLQAVQRATGLVRQILAFSRQEKLERKPVGLLPVVVESFKLLRATIPATIEFVTTLAADAPIVLADANQIHQILLNLGTNAWHAMKDRKGQIEVRLERFEVDALYAASQPRLRPGLYARISVSDTGCGMDPATLRRIFEPFFTTKPVGEGTGLGLAVVHGIMESHDGVITVYSQPGAGTVFHLYFPAHTSETVAEASASGPVPRGQGERILLVDDEELLVQLGRKTLVMLGYEVEATTQPLAALEMVRADPHRYALVITDQTMPKLTGLELAGRLRQIRPGLPILLQTGFSLSITAERLRAAGVRQFLIKPASLQTLGAAIHAALTNQPPP